MRKRKRFSREFKEEAVRLLQEGGRTYREVAQSLGIDHRMLYRWEKQLQKEGPDAFRGEGNRTSAEAELHMLREEVRRLKEEQEILKKAAAFFARNLR